uniref:Prefoldin subunit 2 n=1 Tax=Chromera velia CCMP2878 TaxID=1169474 RepID=A0A0G4F6D9_9ALVE|mmetsp:Transcript_18594/g.37625  ORF Transcript_18594/g.37625 Transcript_18594/m.37625 type:complete len:133 (-) Transcript_18594:149-547(-)|eukprot:Cvel_15433.t1-p1 / transcript=Cvel_15433.t1 / gene=Cvel_15433 / organism=Chromera_velia_CCMP2878 / gene_product=Prefoldin subunit 2, putative / transcript_product=Prefoldin subunit 2, putative / location=Cvel_scaffold1141:25078-27063(+) / protein_length=132 / sequence_SO=supercontig / SO=protein_coding / is_pseudo=false
MAEKISQEQLHAASQQVEAERTQLMSKINEMADQVADHGRVLDAFKGVEPERRCYRLVGGVLVESTMSDVKPQIESHKGRIEKLIEDLKAQLAEKNKTAQFIATRLRDAPRASQPAGAAAAQGSRLVAGRAT